MSADNDQIWPTEIELGTNQNANGDQTGSSKRNPEGFTERSCRSAVCGGDPFIPDTEYDGSSLDFTCDVNHT